MKYLYKYPQAAYPVRRSGRDQSPPQPDRVRVRAARHRGLRRQPLLRRVRRVRQGGARGHPDPDHRCATAAPSRRRCTCCRRSGSATPGRGAATRTRSGRRSREAGGAIVGRRTPSSGSASSTAKAAAELLFTENETNTQRLFGVPNRTPYVKDGINDYVVHGRREAVNPEKRGTKAAAHHVLDIPAGESRSVRLRLCDAAARARQAPSASFDKQMKARREEADEFYAAIIPATLAADAADVMRQALAGMLWSKQFYYYDVDRWLDRARRRPVQRRKRRAPRNEHWHHMYNADVISMPDKWEYPWYAAWDLAFHVLPLTLVDADFGKQQLDLMLREHYLHPNGQIPAYEWNFGDVNPPVHAWSTIFTYTLARTAAGQRGGPGLARARVPQAAAELHLVGQPQGPRRQQRLRGRLPRAGQHRRLRPQRAAADRRLPGAGRRHGVDGALLPEHAARSSVELALERPAYEEMALKFLEHFLWIASAMLRPDPDTRDVGRRGRLLLRRAAAARRPARSGSRFARWSACCRCVR